jgi:hypothetical protein
MLRYLRCELPAMYCLSGAPDSWQMLTPRARAAPQASCLAWEHGGHFLVVAEGATAAVW